MAEQPHDLLSDEQLEATLAELLDPPAGVVLAGRTWVRAKTLTFEHFTYRVNAVKASGLVEMLKQYSPDMKEDDFDIFTAAFVAQASATGQLFKVLAGMLVEVETPWTPATARGNEVVFANLTTAEEMRRVCDVLFWLVLDFFRNGVTSNPTIRKYLWAATVPRVVLPKTVATPILENSKILSPRLPTNGTAPR